MGQTPTVCEPHLGWCNYLNLRPSGAVGLRSRSARSDLRLDETALSHPRAKGWRVDQKTLVRPRERWSIRARLQVSGKKPDLLASTWRLTICCAVLILSTSALMMCHGPEVSTNAQSCNSPARIEAQRDSRPDSLAVSGTRVIPLENAHWRYVEKLCRSPP